MLTNGKVIPLEFSSTYFLFFSWGQRCVCTCGEKNEIGIRIIQLTEHSYRRSPPLFCADWCEEKWNGLSGQQQGRLNLVKPLCKITSLHEGIFMTRSDNMRKDFFINSISTMQFWTSIRGIKARKTTEDSTLNSVEDWWWQYRLWSPIHHTPMEPTFFTYILNAGMKTIS